MKNFFGKKCLGPDNSHCFFGKSWFSSVFHEDLKAFSLLYFFLYKNESLKLFKDLKRLSIKKIVGFACFLQKREFVFYTKGKVGIKNSDFLTKHLSCPGDVMFKMPLFHFGNILWLFLKGNATSLLSFININDLTYTYSHENSTNLS